VIKVIYDKEWVASIRQTNNAYQIIVEKGENKTLFQKTLGFTRVQNLFIRSFIYDSFNDSIKDQSGPFTASTR